MWYSLFFDGEPIRVRVGNRDWDVFLEKEAPNVDIGKVSRQDLCLGKFLII